MMSTYFGSITMVLKLPLTRAASTNGLQRYKGFSGTEPGGEVVLGDGGTEESGGNVAEVGVGERFGPRGALAIERLADIIIRNYLLRRRGDTDPMELKKDMEVDCKPRLNSNHHVPDSISSWPGSQAQHKTGYSTPS
jgi:hypothetical protein